MKEPTPIKPITKETVIEILKEAGLAEKEIEVMIKYYGLEKVEQSIPVNIRDFLTEKFGDFNSNHPLSHLGYAKGLTPDIEDLINAFEEYLQQPRKSSNKQNETAKEILKNNVGEYIFKSFEEETIYPQPSGSFPMIDLIYQAMQEYAISETYDALEEYKKIEAQQPTPAPVAEDKEKYKIIVDDFYKQWCKKTKRNGGVLITTSIRECLIDFAEWQTTQLQSPKQSANIAMQGDYSKDEVYPMPPLQQEEFERFAKEAEIENIKFHSALENVEQQQQEDSDWKQKLFSYMSNEHNVMLLDSDMNEIENIINPKTYPYLL